jgi:two-component system sensor histidine kinase RpfC
MPISPHATAEHDIETAVRDQALVRARLGLPVLLLIILAVWYWGPSAEWIMPIHIAAFALLYTGYNFAALFLARRLAPFNARQIVNATAILDPLMLSGWLVILGQGSSLFICFYLFTILGFGFRIDIRSMRLCQVASLAGFSYVALYSPEWQRYPLVALSMGIFLIIVPMYAAVLIKQLRDARAHAERESQAKSELLANVSHELRTPLSGIVSSAQLIEAETRDTGIAKRAASILKLSGELNAEINNLLDSAKYQANLIVLQVSAFHAAELMESIQLTLAPMAAVKNIDLQMHVDPRIRQPTLGDAHYLSSVLLNLGGNAVKFTEQGRVDISLKLLEETAKTYRLRFDVQDTGIGIPPELHDKIFDPFYQVSSGATRKFGGTGLGTSIARQIINLMGGELHLESQPNVGSLFWFELEIPKAEVTPATVQAEREPLPRMVRGKRVLVADDNMTNLILITELLKKDHHDVVTARTGFEALEYLNVMAFDVVFLDFNMADMDGAQVFELYRFGKVQTAPTFFITADTTRKTMERLREIGAAGVLHKPITFEKLRTALSHLFADEAAAEPTIPPAPPAAPTESGPAPALKAVPTEYIDPEALNALREISPAHEFLVEVLSAGISDIERLGHELIAAIDDNDIAVIRNLAHAMKGVCLNMGAMRLASLAGKLMTVSVSELRWSRAQWHADVEGTIRPSIDGLRRVLSEAA